MQNHVVYMMKNHTTSLAHVALGMKPCPPKHLASYIINSSMTLQRSHQIKMDYETEMEKYL